MRTASRRKDWPTMEETRNFRGALPANRETDLTVEMHKGCRTELILHANGQAHVEIRDCRSRVIAAFDCTTDQIGTDLIPEATNMYRATIKNGGDGLLDYRLEVVSHRT